MKRENWKGIAGLQSKENISRDQKRSRWELERRAEDPGLETGGGPWELRPCGEVTAIHRGPRRWEAAAGSLAGETNGKREPTSAWGCS